MPQGNERQVPAVEITRWPGLQTNANPHQIPPGAAVVQVNVQQLKDSQLSVRPGLRAVNFEA